MFFFKPKEVSKSSLYQKKNIKVVDQCRAAGCKKIRKSGFCFAFSVPPFMWERFGRCWGLVTRLEELEKTLDKMVDYNPRQNACRSEYIDMMECISLAKGGD